MHNYCCRASARQHTILDVTWRSWFFVSSPSGRAMYSRNLDWIPWRCRFSGTYYVFKFVCKFEWVVQQNFVFSVYLSMWWNEGNSQNYKQPFRVYISSIKVKSSQSTKFSWMLRAGYSKMCLSCSFVNEGVVQQNFLQCCEQATLF
jgi:hypothetical protein